MNETPDSTPISESDIPILKESDFVGPEVKGYDTMVGTISDRDGCGCLLWHCYGTITNGFATEVMSEKLDQVAEENGYNYVTDLSDRNPGSRAEFWNKARDLVLSS